MVPNTPTHTQDELVQSTWSQSWFNPEMPDNVKETKQKSLLREGEKKTWISLVDLLQSQQLSIQLSASISCSKQHASQIQQLHMVTVLV